MTESIIMFYKAEKKHSVRYDAAAGDEPLLGAVYIGKTHLPKPWPRWVKVTIEASND